VRGDDEAESAPPPAPPGAAGAAEEAPAAAGGKWALSMQQGASVFDEHRGFAVQVGSVGLAWARRRSAAACGRRDASLGLHLCRGGRRAAAIFIRAVSSTLFRKSSPTNFCWKVRILDFAGKFAKP
jgi:hypothetical protein